MVVDPFWARTLSLGNSSLASSFLGVSRLSGTLSLSLVLLLRQTIFSRLFSRSCSVLVRSFHHSCFAPSVQSERPRGVAFLSVVETVYGCLGTSVVEQTVVLAAKRCSKIFPKRTIVGSRWHHRHCLRDLGRLGTWLDEPFVYHGCSSALFLL